MKMPTVRGRAAYVFTEPDFDVDQIIGVKNIKLKDPAELAAVAMKEQDPEFAQKVRTGDVLVGGVNFGYGHPHYPPLIGMRHLGIRGLIAESFSPGYWRGEVAMGFPQVACPGILAAVSRWDELEIDWDAGCVRNHTRGTSLPFEPLSESDSLMIAAGGIIGYLKATQTEDNNHGA